MPLSKITTAGLSTAAATSNVSIDNGTLFVDVTNNRVGLNGNQSWTLMVILLLMQAWVKFFLPILRPMQIQEIGP